MSGFLRELQDVYTEAYPATMDLSSMARGQTNITQDNTSYYKGGLPGGGPNEGMPTYTLPYEAEEESTTNFNPALRSVQAFPKAASSSLWHGSPFHHVVNIKRQGHQNTVPDYRDVTADPDEFSSNPPQSKAQSESHMSFSRDPSLAQSRATSVGSILPRSGDTQRANR
jgi:hypothetical protein